MTEIRPHLWYRPETYVRGLFDRMDAAGHTRTVFMDGSVRTAEDFWWFFQRRDIKSFAVEQNGEPIAFWWIDQLMQRRGNIHFCTFPGHTLANVRAVKRAFSALERMAEPWLEAVFGAICNTNVQAKRFAVLTGMKFEAILPAYLYDAYLGENVSGAIFSRRIRRVQDGQQ